MSISKRIWSAVVAGALVTALAAPTQASATVPARTTEENRIAWAVFNEINKERAAHGLPAVQMRSTLRLAARRHDVRMAGANTLSHQLAGEPWFGKRMTNCDYIWNYAGENVAWSSEMTESGVVRLERLMYQEVAPNDEHRRNILSRNYHDVGVDVYFDDVNHKAWLTTDFGHHA